MKKLVVYFSRTGENSVCGEVEHIEKGFTKIVAEKIAKYVDAELYELVPVVPYPADYEATVARALEEKANNTSVEFLNPKENLDEYDTIYLGFPNWWRSYPRIVATFIKKYDFTGKVIKPFCTNEEGAFGIGELELRSAMKGALCKNGFACAGHDAEKCDEKLKTWLLK